MPRSRPPSPKVCAPPTSNRKAPRWSARRRWARRYRRSWKRWRPNKKRGQSGRVGFPGRAGALELQKRIVPARQIERAGQRRLAAAEGGVVEYAAGFLVRQRRVIVIVAGAGQAFGGGVWVRPLLED